MTPAATQRRSVWVVTPAWSATSEIDIGPLMKTAEPRLEIPRRLRARPAESAGAPVVRPD
jgi:hypothetical protein